jgi:hypothetical protein
MQMRLAEMSKGEDQKKYEAAVRGQRQRQREPECQKVVKKREGNVVVLGGAR